MVKDAETKPDPTFECFIDNGGALPGGHHVLRIDVKVASENQTFWLDQLRYTPSLDLPLDNQVIMLPSTDPAIQYDSQWADTGGAAKVTSSKNSIAQVNFIGTSISWVAAIPTGFPHTGAIDTWAIDGGKATQFLLPGLPANSNQTLYNQIYFTTPGIEAGPHTLTVTFLGDNQTTPLCLSYLLVKNGSFPAPIPVDNRVNSPSWPNIGFIVGGLLGGIMFFIIIGGCIFFCRRQRIRRRGRFIETEGSPYTPRPFNCYRDNHTNSMAQAHQAQPHATPGVSAAKAAQLVLTPSVQQQDAVRKQQEPSRSIAATRYTNNQVEQTGHGGESSSWPQMIATSTGAVRHHTDGGLRLEQQLTMDIPPDYTPE